MTGESTIGERIHLFRERAGIQSQELATRIGIDPSAMSNIERGKRAVKTEELALIARALGVSPLAILLEGSLLERLPVAARAQPHVVSDRSAVARLTALAELHEVLAEQGIPADPHLADVPAVDTERWLQSANELAAWAKQKLPLGGAPRDRFSDLARAIESDLRVDVLVEDYSDEIAGASITDRSFPFMLVNRDQPATRALFTLAHELGHVLSGKGESALTLDIDLAAHTNPERFANAFAAAFLMPEARIRAIVEEDGRTGVALGKMLFEFAVSFESLVYRLHNIGLINAQGRDQLRARGWTGVMADLKNDEMQRTLLASLGVRPEQRPPELLTRRAYRGYQQGILSVRPLAGLLGVSADDLLEKLLREQDSLETVRSSFPSESGVSDEKRYSGTPV